MLFVGLDVSVAETSVHVVDKDGHIVREGKVRTDPAAIAQYIQKHVTDAERIGLEADGSSSG